jgi:hypothetical protein
MSALEQAETKIAAAQLKCGMTLSYTNESVLIA